MANAVSIRHFILGLLNRQPMSGYDIRRFLKSLSWLIDSPSFGSLYPALYALLEDGLVTVEVVSRRDKPPRKIYSITEASRQAMREWVERPVAPDVSLKAFLMRLILASNLSHPITLRRAIPMARWLNCAPGATAQTGFGSPCRSGTDRRGDG
jgi:DNA-binding PadR family transcriptional regulator